PRRHRALRARDPRARRAPRARGLQRRDARGCRATAGDRKSTRPNSSHQIYTLSLHDALPIYRDDIERFAHEIREHDVRPELEVYSVAMLEDVERQQEIGRAHVRTPVTRSTLFPYTTLFRSTATTSSASRTRSASTTCAPSSRSTASRCSRMSSDSR